MQYNSGFDAAALRELMPTVNGLKLDWNLLDGMNQHHLLVLTFSVPFRAIYVDHAPLAVDSGEGLFIAR